MTPHSFTWNNGIILSKVFLHRLMERPVKPFNEWVIIMGPFILQFFHKQTRRISEFMIAFRKKFLEDNFECLINSTKTFKNFILRYGNTGAVINARSRGTMTIGNGLRDLEKHGTHGI